MTESGPTTDNSIATRMKQILLAETDEKRRFPLLEILTGIPQATWRSWWKHGLQPSGTLVEAVAKQWPHYAFWLATGVPDLDSGHVMPAGSKPLEIKGIPQLENSKAVEEFTKKYLKITSEMRANFREGETSISFEICANSWKFLRQARLAEIAKAL